MNNLVWTKLGGGNVWWVGEKLEEPPEETNKNSKKEIQVVRFFDETLQSVSNPKNILEYEPNKEEYIRSGLKLLKKKEGMRKEFIRDVTEAEKRIGGDENIIERFIEPVTTTPRKSVVKEIFKTDVEEKKPSPTAAPNTPSSAVRSSARRVQSPRKPRGPTPQIANDLMKYACPKCNFSSNRVNVLTLHMKSHTGDSVTSTPTKKAVNKSIAPTPEKPTSSRSSRQVVKISPKTVTPKRTAPRKSVKRKVSTPQKEIAVEEILADWSDAEPDDEAYQKEKKKAKTSQDYQTIFDHLRQAKAIDSPTSEVEDEKNPKVTADAVPEAVKEEPDEDQMDVEEIPPLSNTNVPVSEVPVSEVPVTEVPVSEVKGSEVPVPEVPVSEVRGSEVPVPEMPVSEVRGSEVPVPEVPVSEVPVSEAPVLVSEVPVSEPEVPVSEIPVSDAPTIAAGNSKESEEKEDLDAKFNELMKETTVTLPSFSSRRISTRHEEVLEESVDESDEVKKSSETDINEEKSEEKPVIGKLSAVLKAEEVPVVKEDAPDEKPISIESELSVENRPSDVAAINTPTVVETSGEVASKTLATDEQLTVCEAPVQDIAPVVGTATSEVPTLEPVSKSSVSLQQSEQKAEKVLPSSAISKPKLEIPAPPPTVLPTPPVYAKKSVPQLIEEKPKPKPKRTYSPRPRPSAAKPKVSDTSTLAETVTEAKPKLLQKDIILTATSRDVKSQQKTDVQNANSSVSIAPSRKKESVIATPPVSAVAQNSAIVVSSTASAKSKAPIATQVVESVAEKHVIATCPAKPKTLHGESSKPVSPTKAVTSTQRGSPTKSPRKSSSSEVAKQAMVGAVQAEVEGSKSVTKPIIQQQYLITTSTGAVIAPEPTLPTPAPVEPVKKTASVASSSPTASSLALAQRKKEPNASTPKARGRTYPGRKSQPGSSETATAKPTATVKPTVNVEEDSIIRQALQVQKGTIKSSPPVEQKREVPVEQVVHVVPVQNPDGSVSYMFLSLNDSDELKLDQLEGPTPTNNLEAVYIDKTVDCETLMTTLNPQQPQQIQQQIATTAIASASTSQSQFISETVVAPQQYVIQQQDGQEILNLGSNAIVQNEDGSFMDFSQLSSGDNNIYFMTEDGSIIDPAQCGMSGADIQQFFGSQ